MHLSNNLTSSSTLSLLRALRRYVIFSLNLWNRYDSLIRGYHHTEPHFPYLLVELFYYIAFAGGFWGSKLQQFKTCLGEWETEMHPWGAFSNTLNIEAKKTDANLAKWNMIASFESGQFLMIVIEIQHC